MRKFRLVKGLLKVTAPTMLSTVVLFVGASGNKPQASSEPAQPAELRQANRHALIESYGRLPLSFEANRGQSDPQVKFLSRGNGYTLFLTGDEAVLSLRGQGSRVGDQGERRPWSFVTGQLHRAKDQGQGATDVLSMKLVGANRSTRVTGQDELPGKANYFIGSDRKKWRTDVPTYGKVKYEGVYPGIDLVYYGNHRQLEYDFVVAPGANPKAIALAVGESLYGPPETPEHDAAVREHHKGAPLRIDANGDLVVQAEGGEVRFHKPVMYQEQPSVVSGQLSVAQTGLRRATDHEQRTTDTPRSTTQNRRFLDGRYALTADNRITFDVPGYDRSKPLVIDPVLVYSTYLGGSGVDTGGAIAVDSSGSAYVTGSTNSTDFPTAAAQQPTLGGVGNAFVAKFTPDGSALVYSTYLGGSPGSGGDGGAGIAVDSSGNAYVTGTTHSADFPVVNAVQPNCGCPPPGSSDYATVDAFVAKLNASGNALAYSTYLGGSGSDEGTAIAVDPSGNASVTGWTASTDFPAANALKRTLGQGANAFVTKFSPDGSTLVYSTYLGGNGGDDRGFGVAVDSAGNAYVTGWTSSPDFPRAHALQPALRGSFDAFLTKLSPDGSALVYSTYLGGSGSDFGFGIAVDSAGSAYATGETSSADFPTANAFQAGYGGGLYDAFVSKFSPDGSAVVYSTYLGGSDGELGTGIAVDSSGNAYMTGFTISTDFPTANAFQAAHGGGFLDAFVAGLTADGTALLYSTYLGGSDRDQGTGIAVDSSGNAYVTGDTYSTDFPTANALQSSAGGESDTFVTKIAADPPSSTGSSGSRARTRTQRKR